MNTHTLSTRTLQTTKKIQLNNSCSRNTVDLLQSAQQRQKTECNINKLHQQQQSSTTSQPEPEQTLQPQEQPHNNPSSPSPKTGQKETSITNDSDTIKTSDSAALFEMLGVLTEKVKGISISTNLIPKLNADIQKMATEITTLREDLGTQIADLQGRVLTNEESIKKLESEASSNTSFMKSHVRPIIKKLEKDGLLDSLSTDLIRKISANESAITELKTKISESSEINNDLDKTVNYGLSETELESIAHYVWSLEDDSLNSGDKDTENRFEKLHDDIKKLYDYNVRLNEDMKKFNITVSQLQKKIDSNKSNINSNISNISNNSNNNSNGNNNNSNSSSNKNIEDWPIENQTLDKATILIGDSNTIPIDMSRCGKGTRKRFTCFTVPEALKFVETAKIESQPKKVLFHLGTNDIVERTAEEVRSDFDKLIKLSRQRFPEARIYISSIFRRKKENDRLNQPISLVNTYLEEFCDKTVRMTFMDNGNIRHELMRDPRHVNPTGRHIFITNINLIVFGMTVTSKKKGKR